MCEVLQDGGTSLQAVSWDKWLPTVQIDLEMERKNHDSELLGLPVMLWKDGRDQSSVEEDVSWHRIKAALSKSVDYLIETGFLMLVMRVTAMPWEEFSSGPGSK